MLPAIMRIELFNSSADSFPWDGVIAWTIVWLLVLGRILTRRDFDTLQKLLWVVVVIFVPFFGVFLYWIAAPAPVSTVSTADRARKSDGIVPGSDVAGTPWADNPSFTNDAR